MLNADRLRELLHYDVETGAFTAVTTRGLSDRWKAGRAVGAIMTNGYRTIWADGRSYLAHRLAWLHVHGEWPPGNIDHINMIRDDNRLCNLRLCDQSQNSFNTGMKKNNTSGFKGVTRDPQSDGWRAQIMRHRKHHYLGTFPTKEQAAEAYRAAAIRMAGQFARVSA